jgi:uncharacterized caspase-like protein
MTKLLPWLAAAIFGTVVAAFPADHAFAQRRVALVIGNSAYQNVAKLTNTVNDSTAIAGLFRQAGFDVVDARQDLGVVEFKRALREFMNIARGAETAVLYFAGHGIEVTGNNYLIPVDAKLATDYDAEDEAVSLDRIVLALEPAQRLRLVILDACRDNPFQRKMQRTVAVRAVNAGLGKIEPMSTDTLVAYAAKAGSVSYDGSGEHSPFTTALLKYIAEPGVDIRIALGRVRDEVLKITGRQQEPFVYGSLGGTTVALVPAPEVKKPEPRPVAGEEVRRAYELAAQIGTKEAWESFINTYPSGFYSELARLQLAKLKDASAADATAEREAKARAEQEARARAEKERAERLALEQRQEDERRAKAEATRLKAQQEQEAKARAEKERAERLALLQRQEEERQAKEEAERRKARQEQEAKARAEKERADRRALEQRQEEERRKAAEAERLKGRQEQEAKARAEKERVQRLALLQRQEEERQAKEEAERRKARQEQEAAARAEKERAQRLALQQRQEEERRVKAEEAERLKAQREAALHAQQKAESEAEQSCAGAEKRLIRLRADPSREKVARFARELKCAELRPQVNRLLESLGGQPVVVAPAPVRPAPSEPREEARQPAPVPSERREGNIGAAPDTRAQACRYDEERLAQLRANPARDAVARFARELTCEDLRPQVQRLLESVGG